MRRKANPTRNRLLGQAADSFSLRRLLSRVSGINVGLGKKRAKRLALKLHNHLALYRKKKGQ